MTQQGPRAAAATPAGSRFGSGFGGMLMGGLLGAGLFGLLSGSGLFGGLSGLAGMLGLMLQIALIGGIALTFVEGTDDRRVRLCDLKSGGTYMCTYMCMPWGCCMHVYMCHDRHDRHHHHHPPTKPTNQPTNHPL